MNTLHRFLPWAAALALVGCPSGEGPVPSLGKGAAFVEVASALSVADVARVELTVTGTGISPALVQDLPGNPTTGWSITLTDLLAGNDRTFTGRAYDDEDNLLYAGVASPVEIVEDGTTLVTIFLQQNDPPDPFGNAAPRITGLSVSSYSVAPGGDVDLTITADDPDVGDTLTYAWTSPAGTFSTPTAATTTWTAPPSTGNVVLHIGVSDNSGATATLDIGIAVSTGLGSAYVSVDVNTSPEIAVILPSPTQIDIDDNVYLDLQATDPDGDTLTFDWDVDWPCEGWFDDRSVEDATFYLASVENAGDDCVLTVTVGDSRGGFNTGSIAIATGPDPCGGTICGGGPASGELVWGYTSTRPDPERGGDVTYDPFYDAVVAAGSLAEPDEWRLTLNALTPDGAALDWQMLNDFDEERAYAMDTGDDGTGYTVGWGQSGSAELGVLRQFNDGWLNPGWSHSQPGAGLFDVEVGPGGDPYAVGVGGTSAPWDLMIMRVDAAAGPLGNVWSEFVPLNAVYEGGGLDVTTANRVVVCGSFTGPAGYDLWLGTYDLDLNPIWTTTWGASTPTDRDELCEDVAVDGLGNIFVVGAVAIAGNQDFWVAKFDTTGTFIDEAVFDAGGDETANTVVIAPNGTVYVGGDNGTQAMVKAYRNTLLDYWTNYPPTSSITGITRHPSGDLLLTGHGTPGVSPDLWVGRMSP